LIIDKVTFYMQLSIINEQGRSVGKIIPRIKNICVRADV
jgi:hypothetical protein